MDFLNSSFNLTDKSFNNGGNQIDFHLSMVEPISIETVAPSKLELGQYVVRLMIEGIEVEFKEEPHNRS